MTKATNETGRNEQRTSSKGYFFGTISLRTFFLAMMMIQIVCSIASYQTFAQAAPEEDRGSFRLSVSKHDVTVVINKSATFDILSSGQLDEDVNVSLIKQHENLVELDPSTFQLYATSHSHNQSISVHGLHPGHLEVTASSTPNNTLITENIFVRITVANSEIIIYTSLIFGWIYFVAWSISFYPQIYINFKRKSVVGLNFDFVILNIVGFALYGVFNSGLYWIPELQAEYARRHPRGLNPVMLNDVFFSLHAVFAMLVTVAQCSMYERADQRISIVACGLLGLFGVFLLISIGLAATSIIHWLDFLYFCSYVKLTITIIKYVPQALMNYRRKSTMGWSIGNILLDFTGGILSMLQMILNAYNYDDWVSIFGDPTKFGLGLFSVLFDIFFMLQHYVFYRNNQPYDTLAGGVYSISNSPNLANDVTVEHGTSDTGSNRSSEISQHLQHHEKHL